MTKIELKALRNDLENRQSELENGNRSRSALVIERSSDELERISARPGARPGDRYPGSQLQTAA
jgi:hypothetical protein